MKSVITTIIILTLSTTVVASDFLGPPRAELGTGRNGLGIEYLQGEMNLDADGVFGLVDTEIEDVEFNKIYAVLNGGLLPSVDIFVRLGIADAEVDEGANANNLGQFIGDSDSAFAIGSGAKVTFLETDDISWGLACQLSYMDLDFDGSSGTILGLPASLEASADILEFDVGIGPSLDINETVCLYGGALLQFIDGSADITGTIGPVSDTQSSDLEQDSNFGGFIGGRLKLADTADLAIEYQSTGDSYAFGISILHRFGEKTKTVKSKEVPRVNIDKSGKRVKGYRATINPTTRKPETTPVYEE